MRSLLTSCYSDSLKDSSSCLYARATKYVTRVRSAQRQAANAVLAPGSGEAHWPLRRRQRRRSHTVAPIVRPALLVAALRRPQRAGYLGSCLVPGAAPLPAPRTADSAGPRQRMQ
eukprot:6200380-Pleurochrysis_carterae.AAC.1